MIFVKQLKNLKNNLVYHDKQYSVPRAVNGGHLGLSVGASIFPPSGCALGSGKSRAPPKNPRCKTAVYALGLKLLILLYYKIPIYDRKLQLLWLDFSNLY